MTEHTPGPWEVEQFQNRVQVSAFEPDGDAAGNRWLQVNVYSHRPKSDARLIAAAPDLLAACEDAIAMLARWEGGRECKGCLGVESSALREWASQVIAKARGEQP